MTQQPESAARRYGKVFDEIAAEYDRRRPAYPDELIDQACQSLLIKGFHVTDVAGSPAGLRSPPQRWGGGWPAS